MAPGPEQEPYVREKGAQGRRGGSMAEGKTPWSDLFQSFADIVEGDREHERIKALPPEQGVRMRGRVIDGVQFLNAEDVADLLAANKVLPKAEALIRRTVARIKRG